MEDFILLIKCTVTENNISNIVVDAVDNNITLKSLMEETKAEKFGTIAGVAIAALFVVLSLDSFFKTDNIKLFIDLNEILGAKTISRTVALIILAILTPIVIIALLLALLYKIVCFYIIKINDERFMKFLDSFDVFWSLEDDSSKSVISVLGIIESDSPQVLVNNIKAKLENLIENKKADKIFYRRHERYGFYYWRKYGYVDMDQHVKLIGEPDELLTVKDLENIMTTVSQQQLPYANQGLFQILITNQRLYGNKTEKGEYGIIFRIHHSVGDGVALIDFLCKTLADNTDTDSPANMFYFPETTNIKRNSPKNIVNMLSKLYEIPVCFVDGILRVPNDNSLHGPKLNWKKVFKWTEIDGNMYQKVKEIKNNVVGLKFSDILAAALSAGLHNYFTKTMHDVPEEVAVVLPVRYPKSKRDDALDFKNDFSVTIMDLPTRETDNVLEIQAICNKLRQSEDPITNYFFLKLVGSVLPKQILQPLLNSSQATMIFSNMPGPNCVSMCGGNLLKSLVFFVPHKGTTGLGITSLYYGGVLRFAAMADTALVSTPEDLELVLDGMVHEISRLHRRYVTKV